MLALEQEYIRRFPEDSAPDPLRTRAGSREDAGSPSPAATSRLLPPDRVPALVPASPHGYRHAISCGEHRRRRAKT